MVDAMRLELNSGIHAKDDPRPAEVQVFKGYKEYILGAFGDKIRVFEIANRAVLP